MVNKVRIRQVEKKYLCLSVMSSEAQLHRYMYIYVCCMEQCCLLTQPFLPQASRQFDQEGRKKFFTLDMNNILLEWVGQLLNHSQPNPSSLSPPPFSSLSHSFSADFPHHLSCCLSVFLPFVCVNDMLLISIPVSCSSNFIYVHPPPPHSTVTALQSSVPLLFFISLTTSCPFICLTMLTSSSSQYRAAGPGAASRGAFRHLLALGGICAVQQRSPPQTAEEAQPQHPGEWKWFRMLVENKSFLQRFVW